MLIKELLTTVAPPMFEGSWEEYFAGYHERPEEAARVERIALDLLAHGQQEPGRVDFSEDGSLYLGNGNHRLYAAILLGWDSYAVTYGEPYHAQVEEPEVYESTHLVVSTNLPYRESDGLTDVMDFVLSRMSRRLTPTCWLEVEGAYSSVTGLGVEFDFMLLKLPDSVLPVLVRTFLREVAPVLPPEAIEYVEARHVFDYNERLWRPT